MRGLIPPSPVRNRVKLVPIIIMTIERKINKKSKVILRRGSNAILIGFLSLHIRFGILLPKLFGPTVRKNCSSDREKNLEFEAEGREFEISRTIC